MCRSRVRTALSSSMQPLARSLASLLLLFTASLAACEPTSTQVDPPDDTTSTCDNGLDDNCNGLIDDGDPECKVDGVEVPRPGGCETEDAGTQDDAGEENDTAEDDDAGDPPDVVEATCDDGLQNGDELGVDCGGACSACPPPPECGGDEDCENGTCGPDSTCTCSAGYEKQDGGCVDVDECLASPCHSTERCENTPGGYTCTCPQGGRPEEEGCAFTPSCAAIKRAMPDAQDGLYLIDADGEGPAPVTEVTCDMTTDGGVGYTMLRIEDEALLAGSGAQGAYFEACAAQGMELVVPRSRSHMDSLVSYNGGLLNILGIYPDVDQAVGLNHFSGRCQGQPCDFWLSDSNNASCAGGFEPSGNNNRENALIRQGFSQCGLGTWDDQADTVEIGGSVVCSTNDAGPVPRTCRDAVQRDIRINVSGEGAEGQRGIYTLDTDGPDGPLAPYATWCEGEWTLVLKTAMNSALHYGHPVWTSLEDLNTESADLSPTDARLPSYAQVPVGQAVLAMGDYVLVAEIADPAAPDTAPASVLAIMTAGRPLLTSNDRGEWLAMVADRRGGLQEHCNLQGFNAGASPEDGSLLSSGVRFGILGNNEIDCSSADSFIGIGHTGQATCGEAGVVSGNNSAFRCASSGELNLPLPGQLFVREP